MVREALRAAVIHCAPVRRLDFTRLQRFARASLVAAAVLLGGGRAVADTIATVTLTSSGPDQNLPLGSSFYLQGDASDSSLVAVAPVFVRYSHNVWGIGSSLDCGDIASGLGPLPDDTDVFKPKQSNGTLGSVWARPGNPHEPLTVAQRKAQRIYDKSKNDPVFMPGAWVRSADTDKQFKILVGSDFFLSGARYCMFVYKQTKKATDQTEKVLQIAKELGSKISACAEKIPDLQSAQPCADTSIKDATTAIQGLIHNANMNWLSGDLLPASVDLVQTRSRALKHATALATVLGATNIRVPGDNTNPDFAQIVLDPAPLAGTSSENQLVTIIARLLVREGKLYTVIDPKAPMRLFSDSGQHEVRYLGVLDDYSGVRMIEDPTTVTSAGRTPLQLDMSRIAIPDTSINLKDLMRLAKHEIKFDGDYLALAKLNERLTAAIDQASSADPAKAADAASAQAKLADFATTLDQWRDLIKVSRAESDTLHQAIWFWMRGVMGGSDQSALFVDLHTDLTDAANARQRLSSAKANSVDNVTAGLPYTDRPLDAPAQMTQKTFFTTYVTPVVGYADYLTTSENFWVPYVGVQTFFFPNPVEEPMWSNGASDWRRLLAVELGVAPKSSGFGPSNRYATVNGVPPFFMGLALQVIPYVTLSGGYAVLGTKSNELSQAATKTIGSFYVAASVQANVPDLIRALANGGSNTSSTSQGGSK